MKNPSCACLYGHAGLKQKVLLSDAFALVGYTLWMQ